jgi:uncharacterized protein
MTFESRLYVGSVTHRRFRPARHRLRYRMYWILFDVDEIDALAEGLRWFSRNRFNLVSFFDRDHGSGDGQSVRAYVEQALGSAGIPADGGTIRLLCMPRVFGYSFNPISIFFCYGKDDALHAILYEVHNTFSQRHAYLVPVTGRDAAALKHGADKRFYVSPFMGMDMRYEFNLLPPGDRVAVAIKGADQDGLLISATLVGRARRLSDRGLLRVLVTHPMLTLKVISAIHWNALLLWLKGVRLRDRPAEPDTSVTVVAQNGSPS